MFKLVNWTTVKKLLPLFLVIYLPSIILLLIVGGIAMFADIPVEKFLNDPSQIVGYDSYIGLINNLGIVLWASAMAVCIFIFIALRRMGKDEDISKYFLFSGLLTLTLLLDDLFLIHEWLHSYISELIVPVVFLFLFILLLFRFRRIILKTDYIILIIAIGLFGISTVLDISQSMDIGFIPGGILSFIEEGCKFLGIISWLAYFGRAGLMSLRSTNIT